MLDTILSRDVIYICLLKGFQKQKIIEGKLLTEMGCGQIWKGELG